jgi:vacuolar protein sorting-associated protein 18
MIMPDMLMVMSMMIALLLSMATLMLSILIVPRILILTSVVYLTISCHFFRPDFAQIDQIKDEICEALTSYSSRIERYLKDMNEYDRTCDNLREEISRLRSHRMRIKTDARCALTNMPVASSGAPFYVFPSGFVYLGSALRSEVMPHLTEKQRARVLEIENKLKALGSQDPVRLALQNEYDGLIAAECPLTGAIIVDSIDRDFADSEEVTESNSLFNVNVERVEV